MLSWVAQTKVYATSVFHRHFKFTRSEIGARTRHLFRSRIRMWMRAQAACGRSCRFRGRGGRRCFEQIRQPFTATMFQPVPVTYRQNRDDGNGEEDSSDAGEFRSGKERDNHGQRMEMNSLAN